MASRTKRSKRLLVSLMAFSFLTSPCVLANDGRVASTPQRTLAIRGGQTRIAANTEPASVVRDVSLAADGSLSVRIVDQSGNAVRNVGVAVGFQGTVIAQAISDNTGQVRVTGLRPGTHVIAAGYGSNVYRLWTVETAPPAALKNPALVVEAGVARGQYGPMMGYPMQPMMGPGMMAPGLLATTVTAAAVAAVVIGKNSSSGSSSPASP